MAGMDSPASRYLTSACRALGWEVIKFGMAIATRMPMNATTILSSIKVKPWDPFGTRFGIENPSANTRERALSLAARQYNPSLVEQLLCQPRAPDPQR